MFMDIKAAFKTKFNTSVWIFIIKPSFWDDLIPIAGIYEAHSNQEL